MTTRPRLTSQGVRQLDERPQRHQHRYVPTYGLTPGGKPATEMKCWCGDVSPDSET